MAEPWNTNLKIKLNNRTLEGSFIATLVHIYNIFTFTLMLKRCSLRFSCRCVVYERTYTVSFNRNTNYYPYDMHDNKIVIQFGCPIISTITKALTCLCYWPQTQTSVRVTHIGYKPPFVLSTSETILGLCYSLRTQTSVCVIHIGHKPQFVLSASDTNLGLCYPSRTHTSVLIILDIMFYLIQ